MRLIDADAIPWTDLNDDIPNCKIKVLITFADKVNKMPTIEERKWIPCSERLPEKNGRYLVTRGLNAIGALWNRVYIVNYSDLMGIKSTKIFWIGNVGKSDFERIEDVIAWMQLPEPYNGGMDNGDVS